MKESSKRKSLWPVSTITQNPHPRYDGCREIKRNNLSQQWKEVAKRDYRLVEKIATGSSATVVKA